MSTREILHLLLVTETQNDAENIVSLLRNTGIATRAQQVTSLVHFNELLHEKTWDLLISLPSVGDIHYADVLRQINRLKKDLPVILLTNGIADTSQQEQYLEHGVAALAAKGSDALLLLNIQRELENLYARRAYRALEIRLRETEKRCQTLLESSRDAISYIHDGMHVYANKAYLDLFGYEKIADLTGVPILDLIGPQAQQEFKQVLKELQQEQGKAQEHKSSGVNNKGKTFPIYMHFAPASYADEACTQVTIQIENADRSSELEKKLKDLSSLDQLTGLFNKQHFFVRLEEAVEMAVRKDAQGALLYINIDGFGKIKSEVGINYCDSVIQQVARALRNELDSKYVLARIGEDIFGCLCLDIDADQATSIAENLRKTVESLLINVANRTVTTTVSIGISLVTDTSSRPDELMQHAHEASDAVRDQESTRTGNGVHLFLPPKVEAQAPAEDFQQILAEALRNNSFKLMFQPIISIRGDEIEHYETFLRVKLPNGEEMSAGVFFANANVSDLLKRKLDRWVILHTSKRLGEHCAKGHSTRMFINLCSASVTDETLANWINVALNAAKLPKGSVVFQIHEDDASRHLAQVRQFSQALQEKGIPISISRFGCALNPLQALQHIDATYIKIDGSFVQDIGNPKSNKALNKLFTELHQLGKVTIVPQVENATIVPTLWQMGVHFIQGYSVQAPSNAMSFGFNDGN
ncbi:MAG: EAL domain-containing protein [Venatoribacter sp.]